MDVDILGTASRVYAPNRILAAAKVFVSTGRGFSVTFDVGANDFEKHYFSLYFYLGIIEFLSSRVSYFDKISYIIHDLEIDEIESSGVLFKAAGKDAGEKIIKIFDL